MNHVYISGKLFNFIQIDNKKTVHQRKFHLVTKSNIHHSIEKAIQTCPLLSCEGFRPDDDQRTRFLLALDEADILSQIQSPDLDDAQTLSLTESQALVAASNMKMPLLTINEIQPVTKHMTQYTGVTGTVCGWTSQPNE